ncbi:hypothetical protein BD779DRAFT_1556422, partial [Infundibulicybe gibba]
MPTRYAQRVAMLPRNIDNIDIEPRPKRSQLDPADCFWFHITVVGQKQQEATGDLKKNWKKLGREEPKPRWC